MGYIKELMICVLILIVIVSFDIIISNHYKFEMKKIEQNIGLLEEKLKDEDYDKDLINLIKSDWYNFEEKSAFYVEHDELEKVSLRIESVKKYIEIEEKNDAIVGLEEIEFLIKHIYEKDKLKLKNIF